MYTRSHVSFLVFWFSGLFFIVSVNREK